MVDCQGSRSAFPISWFIVLPASLTDELRKTTGYPEVMIARPQDGHANRFLLNRYGRFHPFTGHEGP